MHFEFLLEEASMENVINALLERITATQPTHTWETHPHNGKSVLLKQLPKKLRGYSHWLLKTYPQAHILILIDQDHEADCNQLKRQLLAVAAEAGVAEITTVRIVIPMLESWFLGDPEALENVFPKLRRSRLGKQAKYRKPDERPNPADDLDRELRSVGYAGYYKLQHSQQISQHLRLEAGFNHSRSFQIALIRLQMLLNL